MLGVEWPTAPMADDTHRQMAPAFPHSPLDRALYEPHFHFTALVHPKCTRLRLSFPLLSEGLYVRWPPPRVGLSASPGYTLG